MCCSSMHHWKVAMGALPLFRSVIASIVTTNWFFRLTCDRNHRETPLKPVIIPTHAMQPLLDAAEHINALPHLPVKALNLEPCLRGSRASKDASSCHSDCTSLQPHVCQLSRALGFRSRPSQWLWASTRRQMTPCVA
jgi:hypothetical protein